MKSKIAESTSSDNIAENDEGEFSESILKAQQEADRAADDAEQEKENNSTNDDENAPLVAPKLLDLQRQDILDKTSVWKQKNSQLDILLLKAESYSHFILENQKRAEESIANTSATDSEKKRKMASSSNDHASPCRSSKRGKSAGRKTPDSAVAAAATPSGGDVQGAFQQPPNLEGGSLMHYQLEGVRWLLSLYENGLSGILADEMGLGKTIQVIALVAKLRSMQVGGPFLIAGPLATLMNWVKEFKKWLPSCPVLLYHGSKDERQRLFKDKMKVDDQNKMSFPIVITSFEICLIDRSYLERFVWQYIILDEGHRIKNRNCKLVRELKLIPSVSRLLLTGTPIQNTLEELWSLLNFCSPMIFDDLNVFQSWFGFKNIGKDTQVDDIISTEKQQSIVSKLHEILRPFLLRRLKKDVLLRMPPKKEFIVYCGLTSVQQEYYAMVGSDTLRDRLIHMGIENSQAISQMNKEMNYRKVCNHPFLFGEPRGDDGLYLGEKTPSALVKASGKFKLLDRMLPTLQRQGSKVLIFSQMTQLISILEDYLIYKGYRYCKLDGSTKLHDRQDQIELFNADKDVFVFLLSTRAGGLGINLTAADTCFLFDSDYNPHQDAQAQDRCHRIGQVKPVCVYRLITTNSVEIEMMEKQISKRKLERMTVIGGDFRKAGRRAGSELTLAKLRDLLSDDVNLSRMTASSSTPSLSALDGAVAAIDLNCDISDEELLLIMDRKKIFNGYDSVDLVASGEAAAVQSLVPAEGAMYDMIAGVDVNLLGGF